MVPGPQGDPPGGYGTLSSGFGVYLVHILEIMEPWNLENRETKNWHASHTCPPGPELREKVH